MAAGFDEGAGDAQGDGADDVDLDAAASPLFVDEETFCLWLDSTEFTAGLQVQKWWAGLVACENDNEDALKMGDDETTVDLYRRIVSSLEKEGEGREKRGPGPQAPAKFFKIKYG